MIYSNVKIENFRCFKKLNIDKMKRVNLVLGKNNVGKTALLEALFALSGNSGELMVGSDVSRGIPFMINLSKTGIKESPLNNFFYDFDTNKNIVLKSFNKEDWHKVTINSLPSLPTFMLTTFENGDQCEFVYENSNGDSFSNKMIFSPEKQQFSFDKNRPVLFECVFLHNGTNSLTDDVERLSRLLEDKKKNDIIDALRIIELRLEDISISTRANGPMILIDIGKDRLMPLALSGLGMIKVLHLIIVMLSAPGGVVLIDEVDTGMHLNSLSSIWTMIDKISRDHDIQIIATTHSLECVKTAAKSFSSDDDFDLGIFRLEKDLDENIKVVSYDRDNIKIALENDWEIR